MNDQTDTIKKGAAGSGGKQGRAQRSKLTRPTHILPTDRIAFPKQLDLLRAWAVAATTNPAKNEAVAAISSLTASTVSMANAFFVDIGLLKRTDAGLSPAVEVIEYQRAAEWNPNTATEKLRPVLERSWFAQALLPRLGLRSLNEDDAITVLAEACSALPPYRGQLAVLLQYLEVGGVVVKQGDLVTRPRQITPPPPPPKGALPAGDAQGTQHDEENGGPTPPSVGGVNLNFSVKADLAELGGWDAARITAFFNGIAQVLAAKGGLEK